MNPFLSLYISDEAPTHGHMFQKAAFANCLKTFEERNVIMLSEDNEDYAFNHQNTNITENATNVPSEGENDTN